MLKFRQPLILGAIFLKLISLICSNSSFATSHSPAATQSFQAIEQFLLAQQTQTKSPCPGLCEPEDFPNYTYLTQQLYRALKPAHRIWMEAEQNAEITEEQIRASNSLIQELHHALLEGAPSRLASLIPEFQTFIELDMRVKSELRSQGGPHQIIPLMMSVVGVGCVALPPPPIGVSICGASISAGVFCSLWNSPREIFCPTLPEPYVASRRQTQSLLMCPVFPAAGCSTWPTEEISLRADAANRLQAKLAEIAVPNIIKPDFLLLILAQLYYQTSFELAPDLNSIPNPLWNGAARSNPALTGSPKETTPEELPSANSPAENLPQVESCPICLEPGSPEHGFLRATLCRHKFHLKCLKKWMRNRAGPQQCPICRAAIH